MDNLIKIAVGMMLVVGMGSTFAACDKDCKDVESWNKQVLFEAFRSFDVGRDDVGRDYALPSDNVEIITGYVGDDFNEKHIEDFNKSVSSKFSKSGIAKSHKGSFAKLPPEVMLHIINFIGTKWIPYKNAFLPRDPVVNAVVPYGKDSIAVAQGNMLRILNLKTLTLIKTLVVQGDSEIRFLEVLPNHTIAVGCRDGRIITLDVNSDQPVNQLCRWQRGPSRGLAYLTDDTLASASLYNTINLWNMRTGAVKTLSDAGLMAAFVAPSPHVFVTRQDVDRPWIDPADIKIWDAVSEKCIRTISAHGSLDNRLTVISPTTVAVPFYWDINILNISSGEWIKTIKTERMSSQIGSVKSLVKLPGGKLAVGFAGFGGAIDIVDTASGRCLQELETGFRIELMAKLPGNRLAVIGRDDKQIKVYQNVLDCDHIIKNSWFLTLSKLWRRFGSFGSCGSARPGH